MARPWYNRTMFNAVYRPSLKTSTGAIILGTPFKEAMPAEVKYLREAFEVGKAGERPLGAVGRADSVVAGRVFVGVAYK